MTYKLLTLSLISFQKGLKKLSRAEGAVLLKYALIHNVIDAETFIRLFILALFGFLFLLNMFVSLASNYYFILLNFLVFA